MAIAVITAVRIGKAHEMPAVLRETPRPNDFEYVGKDFSGRSAKFSSSLWESTGVLPEDIRSFGLFLKSPAHIRTPIKMIIIPPTTCNQTCFKINPGIKISAIPIAENVKENPKPNIMLKKNPLFRLVPSVVAYEMKESRLIKLHGVRKDSKPPEKAMK